MISLQGDIKSQGAGSVELQIPQRFHPGCKLVLDTHLPPAKYTALPSHVHVSLSRGIVCADCPQLSQPHERPPVLPSDLLAQGSHSSNAGSSAPDTQ